MPLSPTRIPSRLGNPWRFFSHTRCCATAVAALLLTCGTSARADLNRSMKQLAPFLEPAPASEKAEAGDLKALEKRLIAILEIMERTNLSNGPSARSLVVNTLNVHLRDQIGPSRRMLTASNLAKNWQLAHDLGLFTESLKLSPFIQNGRDRGGKITFGYIVPPEVAPAFSTDLANIRILTPTARAALESPPEERDQAQTRFSEAYAMQLATFRKEALEGVMDKLGRTETENLQLWQAEVDADPSTLTERPNIQITGDVSSTPSSKNDERWRVTLQMRNVSRHPTEVTVEYLAIGASNREGVLYVLDRRSETIKLRSSGTWTAGYWTQPTKTYQALATELDWQATSERVLQRKYGNNRKKFGQSAVEFRGWAARVLHRGEPIAVDASQVPMRAWFDDEAPHFATLADMESGSGK